MSASEEWRPVAGHEGHYEVSDKGRVRSLKRGRTKVLAATEDGRGYPRVTLWMDASGRQTRVHQLVAAAFLGPTPEGREVRHRDGNSQNNTPANLQHGTSSENSLDAVEHGTHNMASKTHCLRGHEFTPENTRMIRLATGLEARCCKTCSAIRSANWRNAQKTKEMVA